MVTIGDVASGFDIIRGGLSFGRWVMSFFKTSKSPDVNPVNVAFDGLLWIYREATGGGCIRFSFRIQSACSGLVVVHGADLQIKMGPRTIYLQTRFVYMSLADGRTLPMDVDDYIQHEVFNLIDKQLEGSIVDITIGVYGTVNGDVFSSCIQRSLPLMIGSR